MPYWDAVDTGHGCWHWLGISWYLHYLARHELGSQRGCFEVLKRWDNLAWVAGPWETVVEMEQLVEGAGEGDVDEEAEDGCVV